MTSVTFSQDQFDKFALLSGDDNPIHVDPEFSAQTRFGRTVAHGMFLFSVLQAEVARSIGGPVRLAAQDLVFLAPTFTGESLTLDQNHNSDGTLSQTITDSRGTITARATATPGRPDRRLPAEPEIVPSSRYKNLEVGMVAHRTRIVTADDVADYLELIDDPNPLYRGSQPELPPSLVGGMVSWVLGVDLPGRGTNWLKQRYLFHHPVTVPAEVVTSVTITRIRPDKGLINLANTCAVDGVIAASGQSLVLATDVAAS